MILRTLRVRLRLKACLCVAMKQAFLLSILQMRRQTLALAFMQQYERLKRCRPWKAQARMPGAPALARHYLPDFCAMMTFSVASRSQQHPRKRPVLALTQPLRALRHRSMQPWMLR